MPYSSIGVPIFFVNHIEFLKESDNSGYWAGQGQYDDLFNTLPVRPQALVYDLTYGAEGSKLDITLNNIPHLTENSFCAMLGHDNGYSNNFFQIVDVGADGLVQDVVGYQNCYIYEDKVYSAFHGYSIALFNGLDVNNIIIEAQEKKIKTVGDLKNIVNSFLRTTNKKIQIVIYNNQGQTREIGVMLD